jgi:phosphatidylethanolamine/phosphatidyl-N-methylethanolamine N-methyltransferase
MGLFDAETRRSGDAATRALSVTTVETDFVEKVYQGIAAAYDYTYGPTLHPGRLEAMEKMALRPGTHVLEVGVGTGINLALYPRNCRITGIDLSSKMLAKAQGRIDEKGLHHCDLAEMDATQLKFADNSFDVVYAPYVISVVPEPVKVAREMYRVCRPGGRVIILNHFKSANRVMGWIEKVISPATVHIGFTADLDLPGFLEQAELKPVSLEKVNIPKMWTLITVVKD